MLTKAELRALVDTAIANGAPITKKVKRNGEAYRLAGTETRRGGVCPRSLVPVMGSAERHARNAARQRQLPEFRSGIRERIWTPGSVLIKG